MNRCDSCSVWCLVALVMVSSLVNTGIAQRVLGRGDNEFCKPRPTVVAVKPSSNFYPYFVTLHQCAGSVDQISPRFKVCVPDAMQDVKVTGFDFDELSRSSIMLKNHTTCTRKCRETKEMCDPEFQEWDESQCSCQCKYGDKPLNPCPTGFRWDEHNCQCQCDRLPDQFKCLKEKKEWSNDKCGCMCPKQVINRCIRKDKDLDEENCKCVKKNVLFGAQTGTLPENCISMVLLFAIIIGEFLLLIIIFDICLYVKGFGFLYFLRKAGCSPRKDEKNDPPLSPSAYDTTTYL